MIDLSSLDRPIVENIGLEFESKEVEGTAITRIASFGPPDIFDSLSTRHLPGPRIAFAAKGSASRLTVKISAEENELLQGIKNVCTITLHIYSKIKK